MELSEITAKLKTIGIPVAYMKFSTPQKLPFMVYQESGSEIVGADNLNLYRRVDITIELYCSKKMPELERKIENLFPDIPIYKESDTYLPDEDMFMITFTFETIQDIQEVN